MHSLIAWLPFCMAITAAFVSALIFTYVSDGRAPVRMLVQWQKGHSGELGDAAIAAGLYLAFVVLWVAGAAFVMQLVNYQR